MSKRKETNYIVIHSTLTKPNSNINIRTVDEWHRKRGLLKVGYHFFIKRNGCIEVGRGPNDIGAHTKDHDSDSVSVCMAGGLNTRGVTAPDYTKGQLESLFVLVKTLKYMYSDAEVVGHRDLSKTDCPSFDVKEWWCVHEDDTCVRLKRKVGGSGVWAEY
jgi:N-acetylmuramoyl-L-alanine amidase